MAAVITQGIPLLPDGYSDERIFRARTIEAIKELYRRVGALQEAVERLQNRLEGR